MNITWVTIHVKDLERAKSFYGGFLGMKLEREFSPIPGMTIAFYAADNGVSIELLAAENQSTAEGSGGVSIGLMSPVYDQLLSKAQTDGILRRGPMVLGAGLTCFFVTDPDGTQLQIIKEQAVSSDQ